MICIRSQYNFKKNTEKKKKGTFYESELLSPGPTRLLSLFADKTEPAKPSP